MISEKFSSPLLWRSTQNWKLFTRTNPASSPQRSIYIILIAFLDDVPFHTQNLCPISQCVAISIRLSVIKLVRRLVMYLLPTYTLGYSLHYTRNNKIYVVTYGKWIGKWQVTNAGLYWNSEQFTLTHTHQNMLCTCSRMDKPIIIWTPRMFSFRPSFAFLLRNWLVTTHWFVDKMTNIEKHADLS